ncbi:MAG: family 43 glycosylhydrolase [Gemmatimonadota bacterium]
MPFTPLPLRRLPLVLVVAVAFGTTACQETGGTLVPANTPLELLIPAGHLPVGSELTLQVRIPAAGTSTGDAAGVSGASQAPVMGVVWSSSRPNVADVNQEGRVTGRNPGVTRITAQVGMAQAWADLTVLEPSGLTELVNLNAQGEKLTRFDVEGNALDVHGGEILFHDGLYYWYGEYYACGFQWQTSGTPFCGFRVWTSPDLRNWTDRGKLFEVTEPWQVMCGGQGSGCFRPHILRSPATGRWVLWFNGYDAPGGFYIFEADSPLGPFHHRHDPSPAQGVPPQRGDHNLFADEDGTGYLVYTLWPKGDIVVEELTPDYLATTGQHVVLGVDFVEAPALFRRGDRYYLTLSDPACGYCETGTSYLTAPDPLGPWSDPRKITTTSCGGQPGHVSTLPGSDGSTWYLYSSDLWNYREFNQATATQYISPLVFDDDGEIRPITCTPSAWAPALVAGTPQAATGEASGGDGEKIPLGRLADSASQGRLICDVGEAVGGSSSPARVQRELRFTSPESGRLERTSLSLYQQGSRNSRWAGSPNAPLVVEVVQLGSGAQGAGRSVILERQELAPDDIPWSARVQHLAWDVSLAEGVEYALRLSSGPSQGCFGTAFQDVLANASPVQSWVSEDGGTSWTHEDRRHPFGRLEIRPD